MICPKCGHEQQDGLVECQGCGVIFARIRSGLHNKGKDLSHGDTRVRDDTTAIFDLLFSVSAEPDAVALLMKAVLVAALVFLSIRFMAQPMENAGGSYFHLVNLLFHEAGHVFFSLAGRFMAVLGGSLLQIIVPLLCVLVLLLKTRDPFGASVALWWFGQNFVDIAPYIDDARTLDLMLLGGVRGKDVPGIHDWENILGAIGMLGFDHTIAHAALWIGYSVMGLSCAWAGMLLFAEYNRMRGKKTS